MVDVVRFRALLRGRGVATPSELRGASGIPLPTAIALMGARDRLLVSREVLGRLATWLGVEEAALGWRSPSRARRVAMERTHALARARGASAPWRW